MISNKFLFNNKGIYIFSDPAAENSILAIIDNLIADDRIAGSDFMIYTNSLRDSFSKYTDIIKVLDFEEDLIDTVLCNFKPDYIFTGTSSENHEHSWRKNAIKKNIKVISFIDHWTSYIKRFTLNSEIIFGDQIFVVNEIAKKEAVIKGIPEKLISVYGNPYYEKVKTFVPTISKINFFKTLKLDINKKLILFVSDDIKDNFDIEENGNYLLGFDEYSVLSDVLETLNNLHLNNKFNSSDYQFIIKIHPNANLNKFDRLIKKYKFLNIKIIKNFDALTINYYSNYVFGMFSNMVIESFLMKKNILRVQTGQVGDDIIKIKGIKDQVVKDINKLYNEINNFLNLNI